MRNIRNQINLNQIKLFCDFEPTNTLDGGCKESIILRLTLETVEKVRARAHEVGIEAAGLSSVAVACMLPLLVMLAVPSLIVIVHLNFNYLRKLIIKYINTFHY